MDAAGSQNAASGASAPGDGDGPPVPPDPLQRLGAELEAMCEQRSTSPEQPHPAQLYEEAQRLLEEAWGIFTECQVMRDGLLAACHEIERTMGSIQSRMVGLPVAIESNGHGHLSKGKAVVATSANGAGSNGAGSNGAGANGANGNGASHSSNGTGAGSDGVAPGSNGAGPH